MKHIYIYQILLIVGLIFPSCDDYLDLQPKGQSLPDNLKALRLLMQASDLASSESLSAYMTDDINRPFNWPDSWNYSTRDRVYDFEQIYWTAGSSVSDYEKQWKLIDRCNMVINNAGSASGDVNELTVLKANARCHRAYAYFDLIKLFCPQYVAETADNPDTGMPLLTKVGYSASLKRTSLKETYDFVITELIESFDDLPNLPENLISWSKAAVHGMLAKIYLQQGKYELARENAKKCLGYSDYLMNYNDLDFKGPNFRRVIYTPFSENNEILLLKKAHAPGYSPMAISGIKAIMATSLYEKFTDKVNDIRAVSLTLYHPDYNSYSYANFRGFSMNGITTPYVMLIQAESECRSEKGTAEEAMRLVNLIRKNRFSDNSYMLVASNKKEALRHVMDEKRRELRFSESRYCDIKRLNALHNGNISVTHTTIKDKAETNITIGPNDKRWTLLIPQIHIDLNPEIIQNPK